MALTGDPAAVFRRRLTVAASLQEMPETRPALRAGEIPETRVGLLSPMRELLPNSPPKMRPAWSGTSSGSSRSLGPN